MTLQVTATLHLLLLLLLLLLDMCMHALHCLLPVQHITLGSYAGAVATGVDSLFIAGGIDAEPLGVTPEGGPLDSQRLSAWLSKQECQPTYAMAYLQR